MTASRRSVMTLYSAPGDLRGHRVRMVVAEKGIDAEVIELEPGSAARELADLNPYGETPTLVDRDLVLYDSKVVSEYLDERFPHPPLMPVDPVSRAKARLVLSRIERDWYWPMQALEDGAGDNAADLRRQLGESLAASDEVFGTGTTFFLSDELSMMDCMLAPLLWRLPYYGVAVPESASQVQAYAERLFARSTFQASLSELEQAMRRT